MELVTAKEEFACKEAGLIHQVEELEQQIEELKNTHKKYVCIHTYIQHVCDVRTYICMYV